MLIEVLARFGVSVERGVALVDFKPDSSNVEVQLKGRCRAYGDRIFLTTWKFRFHRHHVAAPHEPDRAFRYESPRLEDCLVLMADKGRHADGALRHLQRRHAATLWDRMQGRSGGPAPKGAKSDKAEWLKQGLVRREVPEGEEKLRHPKLPDFGDKQ